MKKFILMAETGADISDELAEEYGIYRIPMHVVFGEEQKDDGTFPVEEVLEYYQRTGKVPGTAAINPTDFEKVFDEIHAEHPEAHILYLAYSARTTATYSCGVLAAKGRDYVTCVDTEQCTSGQCAVVVKTAQYLRDNPQADLDEVLRKVQSIIRRTHMFFLPHNLDFLRAGGRCTNATAILANILRIHPRIVVKEGILIADKKYRGTLEKLIPKVVRDFLEEHPLDRAEVFLSTTIHFTKELKQKLLDTIKNFGFRKINWLSCGGVITCHGGPGAFSVAGTCPE